jgi:hypothetical protein
MTGKRATDKAKWQRVFGHARKPVNMFHTRRYARLPMHDQSDSTIVERRRQEYAAKRGRTIAVQVRV